MQIYDICVEPVDSLVQSFIPALFKVCFFLLIRLFRPKYCRRGDLVVV